MNRNYKDNVPLEVENGIKESYLFDNALYRHFTNGSTLPKKKKKKDHQRCRFFYHMTSRPSVITPCNKIDKPLVLYRFTGNVMTSITTLRT